MKKHNQFLAAFIGLGAGALMCGVQQAQAQSEWRLLRMEGEGSKSGGSTSSSWSTPGSTCNTAIQIETKGTDSGTLSSSGTINLIFGWKPPSWLPNQKPPGKTLSILASGSATVDHFVGGTPFTFSSVSLDDGLGTPKQVTSVEGPNNSPKVYSSSSSRRLLKADIASAELKNGSWEVRVPVTGLKGEATVRGGAAGQTHHTAIRIGAGGVVDTRSVSLSRGGRHEYTKNEDGISVTYGDTTYSYTKHQSLDAPAYQPNYQTISSALSGDWATSATNNALGRYNVTWNWAQNGDGLETGATAGDHYDHAVRIATKGGVDYWVDFFGGSPQWCDADGKFPAKSPAKATLKYFARDNVDNATAEGRYVMTVHEPIELVERRSLVKAYSVYSPAYVPNPNNPDQWILLDVIEGWRAQGSYAVTTNKGAAKSQGFSFGFDGSVQAFGVAIGLGYQHTAEKGWYSEIGQTISTPALEEGERAYLEVEFSYQRLYSTYRLYDTQGEIRSLISPAAPEPSVPYKSIWDENADATPSLKWHKLKEGEVSPEPKNEVPVYSADPITQS